MSGFAGIFSITESSVSSTLADHLACLINRNSANKSKYYADKHLYLVKFDVQAYQEEGWHEDEHGITCLAGNPVLPDIHEQSLDREVAAAKIQQDLLCEKTNSLIESRGTYCGAAYSKDKKQFHLFTDKLGCRPIYYTYQKGKLYFATALRVLEELDCIERILDIRGAVEKAIFGFCLADHTGYKDIFSLVAGTHLILDAHTLKQTRYWSLQGAVLQEKKDPEILEYFDHEFSQTIKLRLKVNEKKVNALFSGGLDSRCVVTRLWGQGVSADTYTFGEAFSYDCLIARQYTEKLGLSHFEKEYESCDFGPGWPLMAANAINNKLANGVNYLRPKLIWTGDAGSEILGRALFSPGLVGCINDGDFDRAAFCISRPFKSLILSRKSKREYENVIADYPTQYIADYLQEKSGVPPLNRVFHFWMDNQIRRYPENFFQNIDLYGIDLHLPFYDSEVVALSLAFDPDYLLYHKMYHDWLKFFPGVITDVTWQHYPGHLPAPLPLPQEGISQWSKNKVADQRTIEDAKKILADQSSLINKSYLLLCILITQFGIRDKSWLLKQAIQMHRLARHTNA